MAKVTKRQLKSIVKECLVEILAEGLESSASQFKSKKTESKRHEAEKRRLAEHRQKFETTVESTVSNVTDDPIMQGILQETARTTLQDQIANEAAPGSAPTSDLSVGAASAGIDLDSIFSDPSKNWDKLAFTD